MFFSMWRSLLLIGSKFNTGGQPSTWSPPGGLVEPNRVLKQRSKCARRRSAFARGPTKLYMRAPIICAINRLEPTCNML